MSLYIAYPRLHNQQLSNHTFDEPAKIVSWFGAIQAQDFAAAKWAIAQRAKNQTDEDIEHAFNEGKILRTHIMRPTWHFVTPQDIRWLLALTSPRVQRFNGYYYRKSGLDKTIFEKSNEVIRKTLADGKQLTRNELDTQLKEAHIPTENLGLTFTIMQAELDGIIVSGPRRGKQFTYMLLDERVPKQPEMTQDEALAELTKRYFQSHGPAQLQDFSWWSGLSLTDAKKGVELVKSKVTKDEKDGKTYWFITNETSKQSIQDGFLLPGFDEYFIAYRDRSDILDKKYTKELNQGGGMVNGAVVMNGKMIGGWKRKFIKQNVEITIRLFKKINDEQKEAIINQTKRFGDFLAMPVIVRHDYDY